jgi:hypothetical protein
VIGKWKGWEGACLRLYGFCMAVDGCAGGSRVSLWETDGKSACFWKLAFWANIYTILKLMVHE